MLGRWDPFAEFARLQDELGRTPGRTSSFAPAVDIFEDKESIMLTAEVPGVKPDNIHVSVDNNVLTIRGERKLENEERKENYHRVERMYGTFSRSFVLPNTVTTDKIDAQTKDGVLTLRIPKRAEAQPRRIEVKG